MCRCIYMYKSKREREREKTEDREAVGCPLHPSLTSPFLPLSDSLCGCLSLSLSRSPSLGDTEIWGRTEIEGWSPSLLWSLQVYWEFQSGESTCNGFNHVALATSTAMWRLDKAIILSMRACVCACVCACMQASLGVGKSSAPRVRLWLFWFLPAPPGISFHEVIPISA